MEKEFEEFFKAEDYYKKLLFDSKNIFEIIKNKRLLKKCEKKLKSLTIK